MRQILRQIVLTHDLPHLFPSVFIPSVQELNVVSLVSVIRVTGFTGTVRTVKAHEFRHLLILKALAATSLLHCSLLSPVVRWLKLRFALRT